MRIIHLPESGSKFIPYEIDGNNIDFNDGDLMFNVAKKERDYEVTLDICRDYTGGLVMGAESGVRYVAQVVIPARSYTEAETKMENPERGDMGMGDETSTRLEPIPFSMDRCALILWEEE